MLEFNLLTLAVVVIITSLCVLSLFRKYKSLRIRIFFFIIYVFLFVYNGLGGALVEVDTRYVFYYSIYILMFTMFIKIFVFEKKKRNIDDNQINLQRFLDDYSSLIIIAYILICFFVLIFPEFKLQLLFRPPKPDVRLHLQDDFNSNNGIIYYIKTLLAPLYYIAVSKKRNKPLFFIFLLMSPAYISYCADSYIARNEMLQVLLLVIIILFVDGSRRRKKTIIFGGVLGFPMLLYAFYQYSNIRLGADIVDISFRDILELIAYQEIKYPLYFDDFWRKFSFSVSSYFEWLLLLPLPGFLKFGLGQISINEEFTMFITHLSRGDANFSIVLPGLVNESLMVFKSFFFIHALIYAYIVSLVINLCKKDKNFDVLFFYMCFLLSFSTARAGTTASYPIIIKYLIVLAIFLYFNKNKSIKKCSQIQS